MKPYLRTAQLTLDAAQAATATALARARELGLRVSVAVVDSGGHPLSCVRMNGAMPQGFDIAQDKAFTAATVGAPTAVLAAALKGQPDSVRQALALRPRFVTMGGGVPILGDGMLLGSIGVSGGTQEQDIDCAVAGIAALNLGEDPPEA